MALINPTLVYDVAPLLRGQHQATWGPMANADVGLGILAAHYPDRTVQISGTFGVNGTVVIEGSNNSTNGQNGDWNTLRDPQGNALSFTSADLRQALENVLWIRPRVSNGDGTTALTAVLFGGNQKDPN